MNQDDGRLPQSAGEEVSCRAASMIPRVVHRCTWPDSPTLIDRTFQSASGSDDCRAPMFQKSHHGCLGLQEADLSQQAVLHQAANAQ